MGWCLQFNDLAVEFQSHTWRQANLQAGRSHCPPFTRTSVLTGHKPKRSGPKRLDSERCGIALTIPSLVLGLHCCSSPPAGEVSVHTRQHAGAAMITSTDPKLPARHRHPPPRPPRAGSP